MIRATFIMSIVVCGTLATGAGCNGRVAQPVHRVTGRVTYAGRPIVSGQVLFTPDGRQGNSGPQGLATINDGRIDTRGTKAPGIRGGPMIVQVSGQLDAAGTRFVNHEFTQDFPRDTPSELVKDLDPREVPEREAVDF